MAQDFGHLQYNRTFAGDPMYLDPIKLLASALVDHLVPAVALVPLQTNHATIERLGGEVIEEVTRDLSKWVAGNVEWADGGVVAGAVLYALLNPPAETF